MMDEIVITGMGVVSPIGCGDDAFWDSLCCGRSGAAPIEGWSTADLNRHIGCEVRDPIEELDRGGVRAGRAARLAVMAARQAWQSAGLTAEAVAPGRVSILAGTTMGETAFIEERLDGPPEDWLSSAHLQQIHFGHPGRIAGHIADALLPAASIESVDSPVALAVDLYGACAAGNLALDAARRQLRMGHCDVVLAGGADGFSRLAFIGFMRLRAMSAGVCRPFDKARDGLLVGEGAAFFVLERASSARARRARVRAMLRGSAISCESYHPTRPEPEGDGLTRATQQAMADAGIAAAEVDYVCAHGTGTPQNDAIEVKVMESCFPRGVAFSSIKALTGHTMGAAAALEAAACILMLERQTLIPTWHLVNVLDPCRLNAVREAPRPARIGCVMNNSAGFGGYNSSVVLSRAS